MSGKLVLVTGVTGLVAGHAVNDLIDAGYWVRGTVRGTKFQQLKDSISIPGLELVRVDNIESSDLTEALKDVDAVLHLASSLLGRADAEDALKSAEEGTLHVLRATVKAGIRKIVITSTLGTVLGPDPSRGFSGETFNESDWGSVTKEEIKANESNSTFLYFAAKIFAEKAVWTFAKEHPELDVTTILPAFVYGPFAKHFPLPSLTSLGTNSHIYSLMTGKMPHEFPPVVVDVRDVARAHVLALDVPRKEFEEKRYLLVGGILAWKEAAALLHEVRGLTTLKPEEFDDLPGPVSNYDTSKAEQELGVKFIHPKDTMIAAVDSLLEAQRTWAD